MREEPEDEESSLDGEDDMLLPHSPVRHDHHRSVGEGGRQGGREREREGAGGGRKRGKGERKRERGRQEEGEREGRERE